MDVHQLLARGYEEEVSNDTEEPANVVSLQI